jgi:alpha-D-xyloside xylohydrolase
MGLSGFLRTSRARQRAWHGAELAAEQRPHPACLRPGVRTARDDGRYRVEQVFQAFEGERLYGLGQHPDAA